MRKTLVVVGAVAVVGIAVVAGLSMLSASDDEPPIHVKNGSLDFEPGRDKDSSGNDTGPWVWTKEDKDSSENSPNYSHEPPSFSYHNAGKTLYVKVYLTSAGTCQSGITANGNNVKFDFSDGKSFHMVRAKSGVYDHRTKIRPQNDLTLDNSVLRYSGTGYLERISIGGWKCEPGQDGLSYVAVCTSSKRADCQ